MKAVLEDNNEPRAVISLKQVPYGVEIQVNGYTVAWFNNGDKLNLELDMDPSIDSIETEVVDSSNWIRVIR